MITFYKKYLSPLLEYLFGHACRFTPTCSEYARQAFAKHPFHRALYLSARRIIRCNPATPVSFDPLI